MNRRNFVKNLLGSIALVAAVKVGMGNVTTEDVLPVRQNNKMLFDICDERGKVLQTVEGRLNPGGSSIVVTMPPRILPTSAVIVPHERPPLGSMIVRGVDKRLRRNAHDWI